MASVHLLQSLKLLVEEAVKNMELSDGQEVRVFLGYLPAKQVPEPLEGVEPERIQKPRQPSERFPYVIIRIMEGNELNDDAVCKVMFGFGAYDNDQDYNGYINVANMIERVKNKILSTGLVAGRYEISNSDRITWKIYEEQPFPLFEGEMTTFWTLPGISREVNLDD